MKVILVKSCYECPYRECFNKGFICTQTGMSWTDKIDGCFPDWCPLKPMPQKLDEMSNIDSSLFCPNLKGDQFCIGWNACIEEIENGD